jgi:hypothetical protein
MTLPGRTGISVSTRSLWAGACILVAIGLVLATTRAAPAQEGGISVRLDPPRVSTDDTARLTVSLSGESTEEPVLPAVAGLKFVRAGRSSQMQSINGAVSATETYTYLILAEEAGQYEIPPVEARIEGVTHRSPPVSLEVVAGAGRAGAGRNVPVYGHGDAREPAPLRDDEASRWAFLRMQLTKTHPRIGETVPVQIKAYFRDGLQASLRSPPRLNGEAFTLQSLSNEPQQSHERLGDEVFTVLTWYTGMSAIKEGEYPVSATLEATLLVPERSRAGRGSRLRADPFGGDLLGGFFDDDFFADFFGRTQEKDVTLVSRDETVRVLPLPVAGRPASFQGAVGRFQVTATAAPHTVSVGDPVTIQARVTGFGNFDRVTQPRLTGEQGWRVYEPSASFRAEDAIGYQGVKTFEQVVIPREAGLTEIPALEFSYFDPDLAEYRSLTTEPIPVTLTSAPGSSVPRTPDASPPSAVGAARSAAAGAPTEQEPVVDVPTPLHPELGPMRGDLRPTLFKSWFMAVLALPILPLGAGIVLRRRKARFDADPGAVRRRQARQAVASAVRGMDIAMRSGDAAGFFDACRDAVGERLGVLWGIEPQAITLADIRNRLPDATGVADIFATADAAAYSGQSFSQEELRAYRDKLRQELETLGERP